MGVCKKKPGLDQKRLLTPGRNIGRSGKAGVAQNFSLECVMPQVFLASQGHWRAKAMGKGVTLGQQRQTKMVLQLEASALFLVWETHEV